MRRDDHVPSICVDLRRFVRKKKSAGTNEVFEATAWGMNIARQPVDSDDDEPERHES